MGLIADFHIHSKYSRATSSDMDIPNIAKWSKLKGIEVVGTGDFTHPLWLQELKKYLKPIDYGVYEYEKIKFILTCELNNIYSKNGKTRKIHNIVFAPSFDVVEKINSKLTNYGKLLADGRPILSLDSDELVKIILDISDKCIIIPAHAWTPHFSVFGSNSGFDSLEECFPTQIRNIYSIETGLSSDPPMNWRLSELDNITLISNSDAHSPHNLGREANVFDIEDEKDLYKNIIEIIKTKDRKRFLYTIEFFPEEGKYHFDGHRQCNIRLHPRESITNKDICPVCNKKLTIGVLHRVEELADRPENYIPENSIKYKNLIPLEEIIADALDVSKDTKIVKDEYLNLINRFGNEFNILINVPENELNRNVDERIIAGIMNMRKCEVDIEPGYDGVYGKIKIRYPAKSEQKESVSQLNLF